MSGLTSLWQRVYFNLFRFFAYLGYYVWFPADREKSVMEVLGGSAEFRLMKGTNGFITLFCAFFLAAIVNLIAATIGFKLLYHLGNGFALFCFCFFPPLIVNYFLLWRDYKYLDYFEKFDKEPASEKRKWAWISLGVLVGIILLLVLSFKM